MRVAVVGAGFAGLAAAMDLSGAGHDVVVLEAHSRPGGLAAGFKDEAWDWPLEHYYHHLFTSDSAILDLVQEAGFADHVITRRPTTASWYRGQARALDGVVPVLTFDGVPFHDRVRMGLVIAYLKLNRNWRPLEHVTAADWLQRWMGPRVYDTIWMPLLMGKFGPHHSEVPMSWLWARLHKRSMRLLYFRGGFQSFADRLTTLVARQGAEVRLSTPVERVIRVEKGLEVRSGGAAEAYDRVIVTAGPGLLARMAPDLPESYLAGLGRLRYLGAAVVILALRRQVLDTVYWLNLDKREFPFLALVEHTNFIEPRHYGGDRLVYMGDYVAPEHPALMMPEEDLVNAWLPALATINPAFDRSWIRRWWVFRTPYAQPVVSLGFSRHVPDLATPMPGLYFASMSQVYPWDRGTNFAVDIGRRAARRATAS